MSPATGITAAAYSWHRAVRLRAPDSSHSYDGDCECSHPPTQSIVTFIPNVYDPTPNPEPTSSVFPTGRLPVTVRTGQQQWAYALRFDRMGDELQNGPSLLSVRVRVDVASGSIGIGCLSAGGTAFLDERIVTAGSGPVDVELLGAMPAETGTLIIRNASAEGSSEATVLEIVCSEAAVRDDADEPRHPPLHEPPIVPGWNRCYGSRGLTPVERLRARRFEKEGGPRVLRWTDGTTFPLADDQLSRALFVSGTYEPNTLNVLRRLLRDGDTFIDVGANAGVVSLAASRWVGTGRVFSIEPSAREFRRLNDAIERNHMSNITTFRLAVGSRSGDVALHVAADAHGGLNTLGGHFPYEGVETLRTETVAAMTLDEFVARHAIDTVAAVKLDIEGAEGEALAGAGQILEHLRPALIVEVFSRSLETQGWTRSKVADLLRRADYTLFSIDDATGRLVPQLDLSTIDEQNIVALPRNAPMPKIDGDSGLH
jgi:FkbM family methyltransferase